MDATEALWSAGRVARLERLCALLSGDPQAAPDLAQETLTEAWRLRSRLVDPTGADAWFDAIARNVCHRWRVRAARTRRRESPVLMAADPQRPDGDALEAVLERDEMVDLVERALRLLPAEARTVLLARYVEELPTEALAERWGCSTDAVSMRLTRSRRQLRRVLETELGEEPLVRDLTARHGTSWRRTRLSCPACGAGTLSLRRDERRRVLEVRCEGCHRGEAVSSAYRTDHPALAPLLAGKQRPSVLLGRMDAWHEAFWRGALRRSGVACARCGHQCRPRPYRRDGEPEPGSGTGWYVECGACGEEMSSSLAGLALLQPESRELRRAARRVRAVPARMVEADGGRHLVVGHEELGGRRRVEVVFDQETLRPLRVVAADGAVRTFGSR